MSVKKNLIVSYTPKLWIEDLAEKFILDPYVADRIEAHKGTFVVNGIARHRRVNRDSLRYDSEEVDRRYEKYIDILYRRLNFIHGTNYGKQFWKKALSLGLIRYITALYDTFMLLESNYDESMHELRVLSTKSYFTPFDFEEHRYCFQNTDFGQEQLVSLYINLFSDRLHESVDLKFSMYPNKSSLKSKLREFFDGVLFLKQKYYNYKLSTKSSDIQVAILGSYFASEKLSSLAKSSLGAVALLAPPKTVRKRTLNQSWRKMLSAIDDEFDKFDRYFFNSLETMFPVLFLEAFHKRSKKYKGFLKKFTNTHTVISENWISNSETSFILALMQNSGVKHIYNEHNAFYHPFEGSFIEHVVALCDIYATLGWSDKLNRSKIISMGSLYPFSRGLADPNASDILFVAGSIGVKATHFSGAYGYCQEKAMNSVNFNRSFFSLLKSSVVNNLIYRGYPTHKIQHLQVYDKEKFYSDLLVNAKISDWESSAMDEMHRSKLVIIDYISTAYIESILADIPTILFWDPESYYLNELYNDFFAPLIDCGVCQTCPAGASRIVNSIAENPFKWWNSSEVQSGVKKFIDKNLGKAEVLEQYILSKVK